MIEQEIREKDKGQCSVMKNSTIVLMTKLE